MDDHSLDLDLMEQQDLFGTDDDLNDVHFTNLIFDDDDMNIDIEPTPSNNNINGGNDQSTMEEFHNFVLQEFGPTGTAAQHRRAPLHRSQQQQ